MGRTRHGKLVNLCEVGRKRDGGGTRWQDPQERARESANMGRIEIHRRRTKSDGNAWSGDGQRRRGLQEREGAGCVRGEAKEHERTKRRRVAEDGGKMLPRRPFARDVGIAQYGQRANRGPKRALRSFWRRRWDPVAAAAAVRHRALGDRLSERARPLDRDRRSCSLSHRLR